MRRKQAAALIDAIRAIAAEDSPRGLAQVRDELERTGLKPLEPCGGEAHSNPFIDNCMRCAPRWGWVGAKEVVS